MLTSLKSGSFFGRNSECTTRMRWEDGSIRCDHWTRDVGVVALEQSAQGFGITPYAAGQFTTFDLPACAEQTISGSNQFALTYNTKSMTDTRSERRTTMKLGQTGNNDRDSVEQAVTKI
jgi:hypothetical protein